MQKYLLLLFSFLMLFSSCRKKVTDEAVKMRVNGEIVNATDSLIYFLNSNGTDYFRFDTIEVIDNHFFYEAEMDSVSLVAFQYGDIKYNLYPEPIDHLKVKIYNSQNDSVVVTGDSVNSDVNRFYLKNLALIKEYNAYSDSIDIDSEKYTVRYDSLKNRLNLNVTSYVEAGMHGSAIVLFEYLTLFEKAEEITKLQNQLSHIPGSLKIIIEEYVNNLKNASVGSKISLFSLRNQAGSTKNFNIFENNEYYSLISVWASWDSLSCEKMKDVVKLSKKFKDKPLRFVNISMDTNDSIWNEKIKELGLPDKNFILQRGFNSDVCNKIGIRTIPYNIVLNNKLIIEAKNIYGKELTELLDKKVPKQFPKKK